MSSSISSSEPSQTGTEAGERLRFRAWLGTFFGTLVATGTVLWLFLLLTDPYDSGRFWSLPIAGINDHGPRTANASFGRDPAFDAAIIGNSTGQLLEPTRLSEKTRLNFVQLTVPGTGPREQFAVMRWFMHHHERIGGMVLVADPSWCIQDAALPSLNPFPFWLYADSRADYVAGLFNMHSLEHGWRRLQVGLGLLEPSDRNGYCHCGGEGREWQPKPAASELEATPNLAVKADVAFPAIDRLGTFLAEFAASPPLVIAMPPVHASLLSATGTPEAATVAACKTRLAQFADSRPATRFVDFRVDSPAVRDAANFRDEIHMRPGLSEAVSDGIAAAMTSIIGQRSSNGRQPF